MDLLQEISGGKLPITSSTEVLKEEPFFCSELRIDIYQPCLVRTCAFHIDHPWTRNCLIYYRVYKEKTKLTIEELELLLKRPRAEISNDLKSTMKKLRNAALKETISQDSEDTLVRLEPPDICVVCEQPIEKPFRRTTKYTYCGDSCYLFKPPYIIDLEKEFGLHISRLMEVCVNTFRSPKAISQALGITPSKLTILCHRYSITLPE
jgi:DNA-directed RNA polymerase subunit L